MQWLTVSLSQLLFSPFLLAVFFGYIGLFDAFTIGSNLRTSLDLIRSQLIPATVAGLFYWVPISLSVFTIVPDALKLLVVSVASFIYNILLCLIVKDESVVDCKIKTK